MEAKTISKTIKTDMKIVVVPNVIEQIRSDCDRACKSFLYKLYDAIITPMESNLDFDNYEKDYLYRLDQHSLVPLFEKQQLEQFNLRKQMREDRMEEISLIFWESIG